MNSLGFNEQDADAAAAIAAAAVMAAPPAPPAAPDAQQQEQQGQQPGDAVHGQDHGAPHLDSTSSAVPAPETYEAVEAAQRREEQEKQQAVLHVEDPNSFAAAAVAAAAASAADPSAQQDLVGTNTRSTAGKRKRGGNYPVRTKAKRATRAPDRMKKITRSRKVNSCVQCRLKKQKCDRQHPVCGNCQLQIQGKNGAIKGDAVQCQWIDAPLPDNKTSALSTEDLSMLRNSQAILAGGSSGAIIEGTKAPGPDMQHLVKRAYNVSRNPKEDFPQRVKAARSAAVGWILATNTISVPDPKRAVDLMEIYEKHVAWYCAIVLPCV